MSEHDPLRQLWRDLADKDIELGTDWPYIARALFADIDDLAARLADAEARAEAAAAKVARVADLAVRWDDTDLGTDRYCAQELREALRGDQ